MKIPSLIDLRRLHGDQEGTISVMTVFAMLLLAMLLGMVMNVGRHVDGKIRLQNAADAAAYSGGVVLTRGMNTLSFSNHLLFDVFALTAFMREARDRDAQQVSGPVLAAWERAGQALAGAPIPRFRDLGQAIQQKVAQERDIVRTFSDWLAATSAELLPTLEQILAEQAIPEFQRAVVQTFPDLAQKAAMEVARRNGTPDFRRGTMLGALWRLNPSQPALVGGDGENGNPTLPAVDPNQGDQAGTSQYVQEARGQRYWLAHRYLNDWNNDSLGAFDYYWPTRDRNSAWMSQFGSAWRSFTCGQLDHLLSVEYPDSNLPHMIRSGPPSENEPAACTDFLNREYTFAGVTYWKELPELGPKLFTNPTQSDSVAFAEVQVFVPKARLVWTYITPGSGSPSVPLGGSPGDYLPPVGFDDGVPPADGGYWTVARQGVPTHWTLLNQHWTCQLVPATHPGLCEVLRTRPAMSEFEAAGFRMPDLGGLDPGQMATINTH
jgi:hypothetical protein